MPSKMESILQVLVCRKSMTNKVEPLSFCHWIVSDLENKSKDQGPTFAWNLKHSSYSPVPVCVTEICQIKETSWSVSKILHADDDDKDDINDTTMPWVYILPYDPAPTQPKGQQI